MKMFFNFQRVVILFMVIAFSIVGNAEVLAQSSLNNYVFYDTNLDGKVNVTDVNCMINSALRLAQKKSLPECLVIPDEFQLAGYPLLQLDMNCDSKVNVVDVQGSVLVAQGVGLKEKFDGNKNAWPDCSEPTINRIIAVREPVNMCSWRNDLIMPNYDLLDVWGVDSKNVFAVGADTSGELINFTAYEGVVLHYDGEKWDKMSIPKVMNIRAVWGVDENDVFAVSMDGSILHYDGNIWQKMMSPAIKELYDVLGFSGNEVYAVGSEGLLFYDGKEWKFKNELNPNKDKEIKLLYDIWGTSSADLYVTDNLQKGIYHYDGVAWKQMAGEGDIVAKPLDMWIDSDNGEIYMTQEGLNGNLVDLQQMLVDFKGGVWNQGIIDMDSELYGYNYYFGGIDGNKKDNLYAVAFAIKQSGSIDNKSLIMRYDGLKWQKEKLEAPFGLTGVWVSDDGDVFAVGIKGASFHYACS